MTITEALETILGARYGREVRQAIHDGIKQAYEDAISNGHADMEVSQARGSYPTLAERLIADFNKLNSDKISKGKVEASDLMQSVLDYFKDLLNDINITNINNLKGKLDQTYLTDELLQAIAGTASIYATVADRSITSIKYALLSVTNEVLAANSVTTSKIADNVIYGRHIGDNQINGNKIANNSITSGHIIDEAVTNLKLAPNSVTTSKIVDNAIYGRHIGNQQITKDKIKIGNVSNIHIPNNNLVPIKTNFFNRSKNLFNKDAVQTYKTVDGTTGDILDSETNFVSDKIYVVPQTDYVINTISTRITFYEHDDKLISTLVTPETTPTVVRPPSLTAYALISGVLHLRHNLIFNEGTTLATDPNFYEYIKPEHIDVNAIKEALPVAEPSTIHWSSRDIPLDYEPVTVEALDGTGNFSLDLKVADVYAFMDGLMAKAPNYITKKLLGKDQSGTYDIYEYAFNPEPISLGNNLATLNDYPTYLITLGTHGNGDDAGDKPNMHIAGLQFLGDLVDNWEQNKSLEYIRYNVMLKVIPAVNPWGVDNKSRRNSRQVDVNRNFDLSFATGATPVGTPSYGGEAPFTEAESKIVRDWILANPNAIAHTDFHTTGGVPTQDKLIYFDIHYQSPLRYPAIDLIKTLSAKWNKADYPNLQDGLHGYLFDQPDMGSMHAWVTKVAGIPSAVIETFPNYPNSGLANTDVRLAQMASDEFGTWILYVLAYLKG